MTKTTLTKEDLFQKALDAIKQSDKQVPLASVGYVAFRAAKQFIDTEENPTLSSLFKYLEDKQVNRDIVHVNAIDSLYRSIIVTMYTTFLASKEEMDEIKKLSEDTMANRGGEA